VNEWVDRLVRQQIESGFADLRGANAVVTIPVSERLLNDILSQTLPSSGAVRDLYISPKAGDRFQVRARLGSSNLIPPIRLHVAIERQPELPSPGVLVLRLEVAGIMTLAGPFLRFMNALPDGVVVNNDRIHIDLRELLDRYRLADYLQYVSELRIHSDDGVIVVTIHGRVN
jgi:hypothetical protein